LPATSCGGSLDRPIDRTGARSLLLRHKNTLALDRDGSLRTRAEAGELACGTIDSWLIWNLTAGKVHATDASNASRTCC